MPGTQAREEGDETLLASTIFIHSWFWQQNIILGWTHNTIEFYISDFTNINHLKILLVLSISQNPKIYKYHWCHVTKIPRETGRIMH